MTVRRSTGFILAVIAAMLILYLTADMPTGASAGANDAIEVVCTTTFLSTITDALGGEAVDTATIIPYGMCPGHFDLSPSEARSLLDAQVLFRHGYEQFLKEVDFNDGTSIHNIDAAGNWMIPENHIAAVESIAAILEELIPGQAEEIGGQAASYIAAVRTAADSLSPILDAVKGVPVVCAGMNSDFATWLGFDVVGEYPRDEDMSVKSMQDIITRGRERNIRLVIDNMQSSGKVGKTIAENLGVPYVMLSNFPDPEHGSIPYLTTLAESCDDVVKALGTNTHLSLSEM